MGEGLMIKQVMLGAIVCLFVSQAYAERNEFVLSAGVGYGLNNQLVSDSDIDSQPAASSSGLLGRVKVGRMTTPVDALFGFGQIYQMEYDGQEASVSSANLSLLGVGYIHYLKSEVGSPYFSVGVGFNRFDVEGSDGLTGSGQSFLLESGYEVNEHLQLSSLLMMSRTTGYGSDNSDYLSISTATITFNIEYKL